jgi:hypothetical protein
MQILFQILVERHAAIEILLRFVGAAREQTRESAPEVSIRQTRLQCEILREGRLGARPFAFASQALPRSTYEFAVAAREVNGCAVAVAASQQIVRQSIKVVRMCRRFMTLLLKSVGQVRKRLYKRNDQQDGRVESLSEQITVGAVASGSMAIAAA